MPAALILVDVQVGFHESSWGKRNNPLAEEAIARLLEHWRSHSAPVYHLQHLSTDPHSPHHPKKSGAEFQDVARPRKLEPVITKQVNSGFIDTDFEKLLHQANISELVHAVSLASLHGEFAEVQKSDQLLGFFRG